MVVDSVCLASSCFSIASDLDSRSFLVSLILMASVMAALVASGARRRLAGDGCRLGVLGVELLLDRVRSGLEVLLGQLDLDGFGHGCSRCLRRSPPAGWRWLSTRCAWRRAASRSRPIWTRGPSWSA